MRPFTRHDGLRGFEHKDFLDRNQCELVMETHFQGKLSVGMCLLDKKEAAMLAGILLHWSDRGRLPEIPGEMFRLSRERAKMRSHAAYVEGFLKGTGYDGDDYELAQADAERCWMVSEASKRVLRREG
ncbi:MAG: hypothetical protein AB7E32_14050 [Desulfovibrio sp.]